MPVSPGVEAILARVGPSHRLRLFAADQESSPLLRLAWPGLDDVLPDGGLRRGVVELTALRALGGATSLALAAVRAGQSRSQGAFCAWVDPEATLHAPGVVAAGVDLARMLVVRPPRAELGRLAVKLVSSSAFEVVVVDFDPVDFASPRVERASRMKKKKAWAPDVLVRKLALAAEASGTTILLITDSTKPRALPWPVSLRLELGRPSRGEISVRVAKDRQGRVGLAKTVAFQPSFQSVHLPEAG